LNFLVWGVWQGVLLAINRWWSRLRARPFDAMPIPIEEAHGSMKNPG
jgi:D-alanyl-lipoteichoic acid acyltransferase DltB (MBOAT superfamily)